MLMKQYEYPKLYLTCCIEEESVGGECLKLLQHFFLLIPQVDPHHQLIICVCKQVFKLNTGAHRAYDRLDGEVAETGYY